MRKAVSVTTESVWMALALVLVIEGFVPFLSPQAWRRAVGQIAQLRDGQIRAVALVVMLAGLALLWT